MMENRVPPGAPEAARFDSLEFELSIEAGHGTRADGI